MYPDLSYFLHDVFGTNPDNWTSIFKMFGLMLVLAILASAWVTYIELKRKADEGILIVQEQKQVIGEGASWWEIISNALFGFIVGFKGWYLYNNFPEFQMDPASVLLSSKGNLGAGVLLAIFFGAWRWYEKNKEKLPKPKTEILKIFPHDRIGDITVVAAVSGIVGAKVFAILEDVDSLAAFFNNPIDTFFSGSGLAIYGGLIGGALGLGWYLRKIKVPFLTFADAVAPALLVGYAVGRIGCQLSGDGDWGIVASAIPEGWFLPDWLWSYDYPHNVNNQGILMEGCEWNYCHKLEAPVYPTPIYEIVISMITLAIIWPLRKKFAIAGQLFCVYLIFNGIERFFIEKIRVNAIIDLGFIQATQAEIIAVLFILIGGIGFWLLGKKAKK